MGASAGGLEAVRGDAVAPFELRLESKTYRLSLRRVVTDDARRPSLLLTLNPRES